MKKIMILFLFLVYQTTYSQLVWNDLSGMNTTGYAENGHNNIYKDKFENLYLITCSQIYKWDGFEFEQLGDISGITSSLNYSEFSYPTLPIYVDDNNNFFIAVNTSSGPNVAKWDNNSWTTLAEGNTFEFGDIKAITGDLQDNLYVGGDFKDSFGKAYVAKYDGGTWTALPGGSLNLADDYINALVCDAYGNLLVAGKSQTVQNYTCVVKWNGTFWTQLESQAYHPYEIKQMFMHDNNLYIATYAYNSSSGQVNRVRKWNGNIWENIGGTFTNEAVFTYLNVQNNGDLYISGYNGIKKWNGTAWILVEGTGVFYGNYYRKFCGSFAVKNDIIYSEYIKKFSQGSTQNETENYLAYLQDGQHYYWGNSSDYYATSLSYGIKHFTLNNTGDLYIAKKENFGNSTYNINSLVTKWDGNEWDNQTEIYNGLPYTYEGNIYGFKVFENNIYIGVDVNTDTDDYTASVKKWNGDSWHQLGSFTGNGLVTSLCTNSQGEIFATGSFKNSVGKAYVAKWNGTAWIELGQIIGALDATGIYKIETDATGNIYALYRTSQNRIGFSKWHIEENYWETLENGTDFLFNSQSNNMIDFCRSENGIMHFMAEHKLGRYENGKWTLLISDNNIFFRSIDSDSFGNLYIAYLQHPNYDINLGKINYNSTLLENLPIDIDIIGTAIKIDDNDNIYIDGINELCRTTIYKSDFFALNTEHSITAYNSVILHPNPATSILNIEMPNSLTIDAIIITDLSGKTIINIKGNSKIVNVENLAAGMYFIQIKAGDKRYVKKFVKE